MPAISIFKSNFPQDVEWSLPWSHVITRNHSRQSQFATRLPAILDSERGVWVDIREELWRWKRIHFSNSQKFILSVEFHFYLIARVNVMNDDEQARNRHNGFRNAASPQIENLAFSFALLLPILTNSSALRNMYCLPFCFPTESFAFPAE